MNYTSVFLDYVNPMFNDINEVKEKLDNSMNEYDELEKLFMFIKNDSKKIVNYENQSFINNYLNLVSLNENDYQAIKYLLELKDKKMFYLPQYVNAVTNLEVLAICMKDKMNYLSDLIDELSFVYDNEYLSKKYYDIFSSKKIYVIDTMEFTNYLNSLDLDNEIKVGILKNVINYNLSYYQTNYYDKDFDELNEILYENSQYLKNKYVSLMANVNKYYDLSKSISDIISNPLKYELSNILLVKKVWIINSLNDKYINNNLDNIDELIKEYQLMIKIEGKDIEEIKRIVKEGF